MKKFFIALSFFVIMTGSVVAQDENAVAQQENTAVDLNAPAPASPLYLRIPHSERTKRNILDSTLDFFFSRFFKSLKDPISYEFFEKKDNNLIFSNLTMNFNRSGAKGILRVERAMFDFSEFINGIKENKLELSQTVLEKVSLNIRVNGPKGKEGAENSARDVKALAESVELKNIRLIAWGERKNEDINIERASGKKIEVVLTNPAERYAATSADMQEIVISADDPVHKTTFARASADGKSYQDSKSFLQAIKKAK